MPCHFGAVVEIATRYYDLPQVGVSCASVDTDLQRSLITADVLS